MNDNAPNFSEIFIAAPIILTWELLPSYPGEFGEKTAVGIPRFIARALTQENSAGTVLPTTLSSLPPPPAHRKPPPPPSPEPPPTSVRPILERRGL